MKKLLTASTTVAVLVSSTVVFTAPAQAATNETCANTSTPDINLTGDSQTFTLTSSSCDNVFWDYYQSPGLSSADTTVDMNSGTNVLYQSATAITGGPIVVTYSGSSSGTISLRLWDSSGAGVSKGQLFLISVGGGGNTPSSSSTSTAPQTFDLSITPTEGTSCSNTSPSGTSGTWINLPGADDCTVPPTNPGATLLGWATSPDFPIEIAQRQVDNGWGAYETFNADGQLTGVFIPAGGATFLSAAGKLYPIWSE